VPLARNITLGDTPKLLVRRGQKPVDRVLVAFPDLMKQLRQRRRRVHMHADSNKCVTELYGFMRIMKSV
jgi:hypothetical protein